VHPIDLILQEYNITRYAFQKKYGYSKNRFSNLIDRNALVSNLQADIIYDMSLCFNISMDEVYSKLKAYESSKQ